MMFEKKEGERSVEFLAEQLGGDWPLFIYSLNKCLQSTTNAYRTRTLMEFSLMEVDS